MFFCLTAVGQTEYCLDGTVWDEEQGGCVIDREYCGWQPDGNGDNLIGISDLLDLLAVYGDIDFDDDGVWDSVDDCVGFYDAVGVCNGNCDVDEDDDGLCDDVDDCVGEYDECDICNGVGIPQGSCDCAGNVLDECGFCGGAGPDGLGSCCGSPLLYQGYYYPTIKIDEQCWFAENLRSENYRNGDEIQTDLDSLQWLSAEGGAVAIYGEEGSFCTHSENLFDACNHELAQENYGLLYNWYAVSDERGLCPVEWHVPSLGEWEALISENGGNGVAGNALKDSIGWNGTNSSGFGALPGGFRDGGSIYYSPGEFDMAGFLGLWWTSSLAYEGQSYEMAREVKMYKLFSNVITNPASKEKGHSIRCIKDTE